MDNLSGAFSDVAPSGISMVANVTMKDERGQRVSTGTNEIFVQKANEIWFDLPQSLKRLDTSTFEKTDVDHIWMPDSITFIADDAFNGITAEPIIYGKSGCAAEWFAIEKGFEFYWY